jgi:hypothetical protein
MNNTAGSYKYYFTDVYIEITKNLISVMEIRKSVINDEILSILLAVRSFLNTQENPWIGI